MTKETYHIEVYLHDSEIFEVKAENEEEAIKKAAEAYESHFEYNPLFELEGHMFARLITDLSREAIEKNREGNILE